jgi:tRNA U34 5-methylaminomethyl-2-thiouridine-forming methyltransferase MnmC
MHGKIGGFCSTDNNAGSGKRNLEKSPAKRTVRKGLGKKPCMGTTYKDARMQQHQVFTTAAPCSQEQPQQGERHT